MGPALAGLLLSFTKLPLLLTPLTYIPVGNAEIDFFGHNMFVYDLIRGSLIQIDDALRIGGQLIKP